MTLPIITRDNIPTDKEVKRLLLDKDNVPILEEVLARESARLRPLNTLRYYFPPEPTFKDLFRNHSQLNFGPRLDLDELRDEFQKIKGKVDRFLNVEEQSPTITGGNWSRSRVSNGIYTAGIIAYVAPFVPLNLIATIPDPTDPITTPLIVGANIMLLPIIWLVSSHYKSGRIHISHFDSKRAEAIPALAHEYVHHVQYKRLDVRLEHRAFREGHARGVERTIAAEYKELEDNPIFEYSALESSVDELKNAYRWMCKKLNLVSRKSLAEGLANPFLDIYGLGTTFFSLLEAQQGSGIYARALKPA